MITAAIIMHLLPVSPQISASAGISANVQVNVPTVRFEAEPPLVLVSPGVYVVQDYGDEVFYMQGYYWVESGGVWYRTRNHHGGWVAVSGPRVPRVIYRMPHGHYRHYHAAGPVYRTHRGRVVTVRSAGPPRGARVVPVRASGRGQVWAGGRRGHGHGHGRGRDHRD